MWCPTFYMLSMFYKKMGLFLIPNSPRFAVKRWGNAGKYPWKGVNIVSDQLAWVPFLCQRAMPGT